LLFAEKEKNGDKSTGGEGSDTEELSDAMLNAHHHIHGYPYNAIYGDNH
jgi:hypothetical protein